MKKETTSNRKIDILCREQFKGDMAAAITYVFQNRNDIAFNEYYSQFTQDEQGFVANLVYQYAVDTYGKKEVRRNPWKYYENLLNDLTGNNTNGEKTVLTKEKVIQDTNISRSSTADHMIPFAIFWTILLYIFGGFFAIVSQSVLPLLYLLPVVAVIFLICITVKYLLKRKIKKISDGNFSFRRATCKEKAHISPISESGIEEDVIYFHDYGRYSDDSGLFKRIERGSKCYVVLNDQGKIQKVYLADEWEPDDELKALLHK